MRRRFNSRFWDKPYERPCFSMVFLGYVPINTIATPAWPIVETMMVQQPELAASVVHSQFLAVQTLNKQQDAFLYSLSAMVAIRYPNPKATGRDRPFHRPLEDNQSHCCSSWKVSPDSSVDQIRRPPHRCDLGVCPPWPIGQSYWTLYGTALSPSRPCLMQWCCAFVSTINKLNIYFVLKRKEKRTFHQVLLICVWPIRHACLMQGCVFFTILWEICIKMWGKYKYVYIYI